MREVTLNIPPWLYVFSLLSVSWIHSALKPKHTHLIGTVALSVLITFKPLARGDLLMA